MFQIVLRSQTEGRIVSYWRSGRSDRGWYPYLPTKYGTRAEAEKELDALRPSQAANNARIFIEPADR
jgi:hypothetical protein